MHRKTFLHSSLFTAAGLALLNNKTLARMTDQFAFDIKMLNDNIGIFTEKGGTIGFMLTKKGIVVVDAQFPDTAPHLIEELKKKSDKPFYMLINTHHHMDHTAGNISFKDLVRHVVAHENSLANQKAVAIKNNSEDKQLYPDKTFGENGWYKRFGGEVIQAYYFGAGHTNGDSIIHFENANIAHMGDLVFNRRYPYIDRSAGANIKNWIKALSNARNTFDDKTKFIFGHAAPGYEVTGSKVDLHAFQDYLEKLLDFGKKEIKNGKKKEEFLKTTAIPGADQWKGDGIERSLNAVWDELMEK